MRQKETRRGTERSGMYDQLRAPVVVLASALLMLRPDSQRKRTERPPNSSLHVALHSVHGHPRAQRQGELIAGSERNEAGPSGGGGGGGAADEDEEGAW